MINNPQKEVDVNDLVNDEKLKNEIKNLRKNNQMRKSFYPAEQMARKSRIAMKNAAKDEGDTTSI